MDFQFDEIFDIPALTTLLEKFSSLTKTPTALLDLSGDVHISTGWQSICANFHRVNSGSASRCKESDTKLANALAEGNQYNMYRCQNGLVDVAVPVHVDGEHVGNFFTGQFFLEPPNKNHFIEQAKQFGFDEQGYLKALEQVPIYSENETKLTMDFLVELTQTFGEMGSTRLEQLKSEQQQTEKLESLLAEKSQELTALHATYETALSFADVGIWEWDIVTGDVYWSKETECIWGFPENTFKGELDQVSEAIHSDDFAAWQADVEACLQGKKDHEIEFRINRSDGSTHWVHARGKLTKDESGNALKMSGVVFDITERKTWELKLHKSEKRLNHAQKLAQIGSWELDLVKNSLVWSDEIFQIFEIKKDAFGDDYESFLNFVHPDDKEKVNSAYLSSLKTGEVYDIEHRLLLNNDKIKYVRELGYTTFDDRGNPLVSHGTIQDITAKKLMELKVEHIAYYDPLTDLPNKQLFKDRYNQAVSSIKRSKHFAAIMFIDLDNFKSLNDTHGHQAGDLLLKQVAERLTNQIRGSDTVARIGGDEFLILLASLSEESEKSLLEATAVAEKVCDSLAEPYNIKINSKNNKSAKVQHQCSASIGLTLFDQTDCNQDDIVKRADMAMYQAKRQGRNQVCVK